MLIKIYYTIFSKKLVQEYARVYKEALVQRFCNKDVLRNFAKFTGKHLRQRFFFNKLAGLRHATLLKKRLWHRCFAVIFAKFLRTPFQKNTSGRLFLYMATKVMIKT